MSAILEAIEAEALKLMPEERICLADHLLASVSGGTDIEDVWAAEVERRIAGVEAGRIALVPANESIQRARQALA